MELLKVKSAIESGQSIFDMPLRVTYYARVSSDKDVQLNSLDNQIFYFENYINENPNWTYVSGYIDEGISGKSAENRHSFMRMIRDAQSGLFDLIITKEISRFSRSTLDSIKYTQQLLDCGVGVYFQSDNINTLLPDSELRLSIMSSIAQDELRKLSERLRFGYKRAIEKGRVLGQDNLIGYDKAGGVLAINEEEAVLVRRVFDIYTEGRLGIRAIARALEAEGFLSKSGKTYGFATIKNILTNPKYKGYYCARKTMSLDFRNNKHVRQPEEDWLVFRDERIPAIVSEEVWDAANRLYKERGKKAKTHADAYQNRYPFSGKIFCGEHGTSYHRHVYKSKSGDKEVWNCRLYRQKGRTGGCDSPTLYSAELYEILDRIYDSLYVDRDAIISGLAELYAGAEQTDCSKDIAKCERELARIGARKDRLLDMSIDGTISRAEFKARNDGMNEEYEAAAARLAEYRELQRRSQNAQMELADTVKRLDALFDDRAALRSERPFALLERIVVHKVGQNKRHVRLEIVLGFKKAFAAEVQGGKVLSLHEIGISQAQVSRLEKSALKHMRKYV